MDERLAVTREARRERRAAARDWAAVPLRDRAEAVRRAKRGDRHPDPVVAEVALRLARSAAPSAVRRWSAAVLLLSAAALAVEAVLFGEAWLAVPALVAAGSAVYLWDLDRDVRALLSTGR